MKNYKKNLKYFGLGILISSCTLIAINLIIDPFQIYKKATFHRTLFMKGFYLNAGLIKQYDYDSVSIGSSMTQNFKIEDLKEQLDFKKPIKLPVSGGSTFEHYTVLESAINTGKVKNVLYGIDIFSLNKTTNRLPEYLYDDNVLNDYKYFLNIDTLKRSLTYPFLHLVINKNDPRLDYNLMFQWQHDFKNTDFSEEKVVKDFNNSNVDLDNINFKKLSDLRIENFDKYILKIGKDNPTIQFKFFYPPYSILTYKLMTTKNLNSFMFTKRYINTKLLNISNIEIYDFQEDWSIIKNLNNYKDMTHYHSKINHYMLKNMKKKDSLLSKEENNYEEFIFQIKKYRNYNNKDGNY